MNIKQYEEEIKKGCGKTLTYLCPYCKQPMQYVSDFDIMSCECGEEVEYEGDICKKECLCPTCQAKLEAIQKCKEMFKKMIEKTQKRTRELLISNSKCDCLNLTTKYGDISDVCFWELLSQLNGGEQ